MKKHRRHAEQLDLDLHDGYTAITDVRDRIHIEFNISQAIHDGVEYGFDYQTNPKKPIFEMIRVLESNGVQCPKPGDYLVIKDFEDRSSLDGGIVISSSSVNVIDIITGWSAGAASVIDFCDLNQSLVLSVGFAMSPHCTTNIREADIIVQVLSKSNVLYCFVNDIDKLFQYVSPKKEKQ